MPANTAQLIKKKRLKLGLTQEDMAKKLGGVYKQTYGTYETGKVSPNLKKLRALAVIFDCYLSDLLCETDIRPPIFKEDILAALIEECLIWKEEQDNSLSAAMIAKTVAYLYPKAIKEQSETLPTPRTFLNFLNQTKA